MEYATAPNRETCGDFNTRTWVGAVYLPMYLDPPYLPILAFLASLKISKLSYALSMGLRRSNPTHLLLALR